MGRLGKFWAWLGVQSWLCCRMPLSKAFHLVVTLSPWQGVKLGGDNFQKPQLATRNGWEKGGWVETGWFSLNQISTVFWEGAGAGGMAQTIHPWLSQS